MVWPELWDLDYDVDIFIETPLHLIFYGILDDVVKTLHKFLTEHGMLSSFENFVNGDLSDIATMRIEWCKVKALPKKQWLGENELAYPRIVTFMYGQLFLGLTLPDSSQTSENTLNDIRQMINSLHVLICKLMSPREDGSDEVDLHVKIFLSCCNIYSRGFYGDDVVPFWVGKGNFMGLLNLGKQITKHGSLRWYCNQPVKSVLVSMRKGMGCLQSKLLLIQKLNVLHWISDGWKNEVDEGGDNKDVGTWMTMGGFLGNGFGTMTRWM